jgi:hypothetical protein
MFGKEATEVMWITEPEGNEYYNTRGESHGSVYISKPSLKELDGKSTLTMAFSAETHSIFVKIISAIMGLVIKGSMKKAIYKDLEDIKQFVEQN